MPELDIPIRVLALEREDCCAATALDMDIWGYGMSMAEAVQNLQHHVNIQLALFKKTGNSTLIDKPVANEFQTLYNDCFAARVYNRPTPGCCITTLTMVIMPTSAHTQIYQKANDNLCSEVV